MIRIAIESIAREKAKHLTGVGVSGTGATVVATNPIEADTLLNSFLFWMPHVAIIAGFAVSCALFYKTYLEIKLAQAALKDKEE